MVVNHAHEWVVMMLWRSMWRERAKLYTTRSHRDRTESQVVGLWFTCVSSGIS